MKSKYFLCFLTLGAAVFVIVCCDCDENGAWMRQYSFPTDGKVTIRWNFTEDKMQMVMIGKTKGWVALAFATSKSLNGSDIVIGWVDDKTNQSYLQDRQGNAKNQSQLDEKNSYTLLSAKQNESITIICWERNLETCDDQDIPITFSTFRVFWAIGKEDPPQENFEPPPNLGPSMGVQSLRLLSPEYPKPNSPDVKTIDFTARNASITKVDTGTVYWCTHFTIPKSDKKSHVVAFEPVIQKENLDIFHHYLLYECPYSFMEKFAKTIPEGGYSCFDYFKFAFQDLCIMHFSAWAVGGTGVNFPADVGFPFHSTEHNKYYMLQAHYDVKHLNSSRRDSSGSRIYYTYTLREKELGETGVGMNVSPFQLIPPNQKKFTNVGICSKECTKATLPESGVKVISVLFHSHLAGRKLRLRIIRDGKELEPLADEGYDFDYQVFETLILVAIDAGHKQQSFLNKPFYIKPGDDFIIECEYDTSGRDYTTVGAFGTSEEMCLIILQYENPTNFSWCVSYLNPLEVFNLTGIGAILPLPKFCWGDQCEYTYAAQGVPNLIGTVLLPLSSAGKKLVDYMRDYNWTPSKAKALQDMYYRDQIPLCKSDEVTLKSTKADVAAYPTNFVPYKKPDVCNSS